MNMATEMPKKLHISIKMRKVQLLRDWLCLMLFVVLISKNLFHTRLFNILEKNYILVFLYFLRNSSNFYFTFRAMRYYDYPSKEREDVHVQLAELEKVKYGDTFKGRLMLEV